MSPEHRHALAPILTRRSTKVLVEPAPTDAQIDAILEAAVTVPDHGGLRPWRIVVIDGDGRDSFGDALADAARETGADVGPNAFDRLRSKAFAAPALIAVVARVNPKAKIPAWEQVASAACVGYAITLAAHQVGLGAIWKSSPFVDGTALRRVLDMGPDDQFLGWVNLGQAPEGSIDGERPAVELRDIVRRVGADGRPAVYAAS